MVLTYNDSHVLVEHEIILQCQHHNIVDVFLWIYFCQFLTINSTDFSEKFRCSHIVELTDVCDWHFTFIDERQTTYIVIVALKVTEDFFSCFSTGVLDPLVPSDVDTLKTIDEHARQSWVQETLPIFSPLYTHFPETGFDFHDFLLEIFQLLLSFGFLVQAGPFLTIL